MIIVVMMTLVRWDDRGEEMVDQDVADAVSEEVDSRLQTWGDVMSLSFCMSLSACMSVSDCEYVSAYACLYSKWSSQTVFPGPACWTVWIVFFMNCVYLSLCVSVCVCVSVSLSVRLCVCTSVCLYVCLSVCLSVSIQQVVVTSCCLRTCVLDCVDYLLHGVVAMDLAQLTEGNIPMLTIWH